LVTSASEPCSATAANVRYDFVDAARFCCLRNGQEANFKAPQSLLNHAHSDPPNMRLVPTCGAARNRHSELKAIAHDPSFPVNRVDMDYQYILRDLRRGRDHRCRPKRGGSGDDCSNPPGRGLRNLLCGPCEAAAITGTLCRAERCASIGILYRCPNRKSRSELRLPVPVGIAGSITGCRIATIFMSFGSNRLPLLWLKTYAAAR
jgi:hypothetical protein